MADILMSAETAAEGIAFGANGAAPLPQVLPKTDTGRRGYDGIIDAVNRLPRPLAACLALLLFLDAAIDPAGFEARMQALSAIPHRFADELDNVVAVSFDHRNPLGRRTSLRIVFSTPRRHL